MTFTHAYNCVSAAVYNMLVVNYNFRFPFELMSMSSSFFELFVDKGRLSCGSPIHRANDFLVQFGTRIYYPDMLDVNGAIAYAQHYLDRRGVLPLSINLKYDAASPKTFDDDHWHFHLLVRKTEQDKFIIFNLFNGDYYEVCSAHLAKLIDTSFNYRYAQQFTPFMQLELENYEQAQAVLGRDNDRVDMLRHVLKHYPLESNLDEGSDYLQALSAYIRSGERHLHYEHQVLDYQRIVTRSRELVRNYLRSCHDGEAGNTAFQAVVQGWDAFRNKLAMALMRRSSADMAALQGHYEHLIHLEYNTLSRVITLVEAAKMR
ncbi:hypothetical protein MH117_16015 [Paenibacillus sp. ACRRX]|uniref:hypothetical protein n=1 Tax=unclassified Paenibacillus TaxID=185978 RepID=UPI001EF6B6B3|nr:MULTISPECIES: hypothetical protein [unclassified Paenibacillus]MCG7408924.1 hypothetical protein [Paenibacillus sp. ACRRX]MDK8182165.1 hypothetical protein [Paenibacillus sp. UMB4589-SE434]